MITFILKALYFFLPAYVANMMPVFVRRLPFLEKPIWESKLGKNKTWRGLVFGTATGIVVFGLQKLLYQGGFTFLALIDYNDFSLLFGALLGLGAMLGDIVKSYYKRKVGIKPGKSWMPFDQIDFVIGGIVLGFLLYVPTAAVVLILLIVSPLLHLAVNYVGFLIGWREKRV